MNDVEKELETNKLEHQAFMDKLEDFGKQLTALMLKVEGLPEKLLEKTDKRYASKTTEKAVYAIIGAVCLAVFYSVFEMIKK